jgi:hypothetical protein
MAAEPMSFEPVGWWATAELSEWIWLLLPAPPALPLPLLAPLPSEPRPPRPPTPRPRTAAAPPRGAGVEEGCVVPGT